MGMFDYIKCEVPLPDGYSGELQTKDFCCEMTTHIITKDGRLLVDNGYAESVPKHERPYPDAKPGDWRSICGMIRRVHKYEDANFHGLVSFGGLETIGHEPDERYGERGRPIYKDHSYIAKFTHGQLVGIEIDME